MQTNAVMMSAQATLQQWRPSTVMSRASNRHERLSNALHGDLASKQRSSRVLCCNRPLMCNVNRPMPDAVLAQESKDLCPESKMEAALDAVQFAATEEELEDRVQAVVSEQARCASKFLMPNMQHLYMCVATNGISMTSDVPLVVCSLNDSQEARSEQLTTLVKQLQQQLADGSNAGLKVLYTFLGLREVIEVDSSGADLQTIPEDTKIVNAARSIRHNSGSPKAPNSPRPPSASDSKPRRISRQESSIPEAPPVVSMGNKSFEVISDLAATRFMPLQPAPAEAESPEISKKANGKPTSGPKPAAGQIKTKSKTAPAKAEADEPPKPSLEDEARQLLPTNTEGEQTPL